MPAFSESLCFCGPCLLCPSFPLPCKTDPSFKALLNRYLFCKAVSAPSWTSCFFLWVSTVFYLCFASGPFNNHKLAKKTPTKTKKHIHQALCQALTHLLIHQRLLNTCVPDAVQFWGLWGARQSPCPHGAFTLAGQISSEQTDEHLAPMPMV